MKLSEKSKLSHRLNCYFELKDYELEELKQLESDSELLNGLMEMVCKHGSVDICERENGGLPSIICDSGNVSGFSEEKQDWGAVEVREAIAAAVAKFREGK